MKKIIFIFISIVFISHSTFARHKDYPTYSDLYFSIGYSGNNVSSDISDYYQSLVDNYKSLGIPMQTQTKFGPTVRGSIGYNLSKLKDISIGICLGYSYSPAFSNYQDYSGTMKINGSVNCLDLLLNVRGIPMYIDNYPVILNARVGAMHSSVKIKKEVQFNSYPEPNVDWEMTADGFGPEMEATIGTSKDVGIFSIAIEGGFKFSLVNIEQYNEELNGVSNPIYRAMSIGPSGIFAQVIFGINF